MEEISRLLDLFEEGKGRPPRDLAHRLRSDSIRPGLQRFLAILDAGVGTDDDGRLGFESWSRSQIEAVVSVANMLISSTVSTSAKCGEPAIVAIMEKSLNYGLTLLEKSDLDGVDFSLQSKGNSQFFFQEKAMSLAL